MIVMRITLVFLLFTLMSVAPQALADQSDPHLDRLFLQLSKATTPPEAQGVEKEIQSLWLVSGSDTVDVLMGRAQASIGVQDAATAKKLFDAVTEMRPNYAEVWYERGALLAAVGSPQEALPDLERAIDLEPRHYPAIVLAGRIAEETGNKHAALDFYRKAVAINPQLEATRRKIAALAAELEGKDI
ncbi:MAG: tetratricopeptide repeat protein [Alphaproteobacteria bacterium]|nr:tetratricopeptide repeat protein [Alphaproteobacteria bacterium]